MAKPGNREHKIPYEPVKHIEMLSSQRESPLKPEQDEKQASQQWIADVIHQGNLRHDREADDMRVMLTSASVIATMPSW